MQPAKNSVVKLEPRSVTLKNLSTREPCAPTRREVGSGGGGWAGAALADRGQHVLQVLQVRAQEARLEPEVDLVVLALLPALLELGGPRRIGLIHLRHRSGAWVRGTQAPDGHSKRRKLTASTFIKTRRGTIPNSLLKKEEDGWRGQRHRPQHTGNLRAGVSSRLFMRSAKGALGALGVQLSTSHPGPGS